MRDPYAELIRVADLALDHIHRGCPTSTLGAELAAALDAADAHRLELILAGAIPADPEPTTEPEGTRS